MKALRLPGFEETLGPQVSLPTSVAGEVTPDKLTAALERAQASHRARRKRRQDPEELFDFQCRTYKLPEPHRQFRFAQSMGRQWRFDFAWPQWKVAVELEGLVMVRITDEPTIRKLKTRFVVLGGHASPKGIKNDMERANCAALLGWVVLRFHQDEVKPGRAIAFAQHVLLARGWQPPQ